MKKRLTVLLAVILVLSMVLSACGKKEEPAAPSTPGNSSTNEETNTPKEKAHPILTVASGADVTQLDPHVSNGSDYNIFGATMDNLVKFNNGNQFEVLPSLAKSWEISDDQLEWTFHLVEGKWHDGTPITADDIAYSINRMVTEPTTASKVLMIDHAEVVDEHTVKMFCKYAYPNLILQIASWPWKMVEKSVVEKYGAGAKEVWYSGSGAYKLKSIEPGLCVLERNEDYYGEQPYFDEIHFVTMTDSNTRMAAFENGEIDANLVESGLDADYIRGLSDKYTLLEQSRAGAYAIILNQAANEALAKKEVRQALRYAIDCSEMVDLVYDGETLGVAHTILSPGEEGYTGKEYYGYDPAKAKELLAAAGYANGLTVKFAYATTDTAERFAAAIQPYWEAIGVKVEMVPMEASAATAAAYTGDYEAMYREFQSIPYNPPLVYRLYFLSTGSLNYFKCHDAVLDELADKAGMELDDAKRRAIYEELDNHIQEEALYIPVCYMKYNIAYDKHIKGYGYEPNTFITDYDNWYWEE